MRLDKTIHHTHRIFRLHLPSICMALSCIWFENRPEIKQLDHVCKRHQCYVKCHYYDVESKRIAQIHECNRLFRSSGKFESLHHYTVVRWKSHFASIHFQMNAIGYLRDKKRFKKYFLLTVALVFTFCYANLAASLCPYMHMYNALDWVNAFRCLVLLTGTSVLTILYAYLILNIHIRFILLNTAFRYTNRPFEALWFFFSNR